MMGNRSRYLVVLLLIVITTSGCLGVVSQYTSEQSQTTDGEHQTSQPDDMGNMTPSKSKLSTEVQRILDKPISELRDDDRVVVVNGSRIVVTVEVTENRSDRLERELTRYGFNISNSISTATGFQAIGTVPKDNITALASHPAVASISLPNPPAKGNNSSTTSTSYSEQ